MALDEGSFDAPNGRRDNEQAGIKCPQLVMESLRLGSLLRHSRLVCPDIEINEKEEIRAKKANTRKRSGSRPGAFSSEELVICYKNAL